MQALESVGLVDYAFQRASTLSGGQQQRAAVARALLQGARILLADEPVSSLDPESARRVMDLLHHLSRSQGMTLVVSLHNVAMARRYCDRIIALRAGVLVFDGPPQDLDDSRLRHPAATNCWRTRSTCRSTSRRTVLRRPPHPGWPEPISVFTFLLEP